ncbi:site-specific DNA-methyltransferase [Salinibacter ruber]|uniref:site-specific DNA-methyltransferase n=1 Tax=Salinibacter ruber TaxID=146919 RepID=UPI002168E8E4|nr:site-specific DNA-methyltransferase [Salinibacter ruber]MCS4051261.1 hypothetical protein [Salinibacter ruber]
MANSAQKTLFDDDKGSIGEHEGSNFGDTNFSSNKTEPIHRWVPWIAGFSSDFVGGIVEDVLDEQGGTVLDPFAGVGTTLVEAATHGHDTLGFEINPYAVMAARVKLDARTIDTEELKYEVRELSDFYNERMANGYQPESRPPSGFRTNRKFYSEAVERKVLTIWDFIGSMESDRMRDLFKIAFAATMVRYSNYSYEPSLGTRNAVGRDDIEDFPVGRAVTGKLEEIVTDVEWLRSETDAQPDLEAEIIPESFFDCQEHINAGVADLAITSPPYLNNYHYIRNTRPQLYWLGFAESPDDYDPIEDNNYGKYWQTVRDQEPVELEFPNPPEGLSEKIAHLRSLNPEKGQYGGKGWANYAATYFNDTYSFGEGLMHALRPGGKAYVVVGNSILQGVNFQTDEHLADVCECAGMEVEEIYTPRDSRTGNSIIQSEVRVTKAKDSHQLYESVVELRRPRQSD